MLTEGRVANSRRTEILQAVDMFIRVHDEWEADTHGPPQPSERFEKGVNVCIEICEQGDMPADCRGLLGAVAKMGREWLLYVNGKMLSDHRPTKAFWDAVRDVKFERTGAAPFKPRTRESVALLLTQKVTPEQIARVIYADPEWPNGYGPFLGIRGEVDYKALDAEKLANEKGGTTLPADWVHPDDRRRAAEVEKDARTKLQELEKEISRENARSNENPEKLLREGQFVNVVARVCNMSIDEVQKLANELQIQTAGETPNLSGDVRAPQEPDINEAAARAMDATVMTPEQQIMHWAELGMDDEQIAEKVGLTPRKVQKIREGAAAGV